MGLDVIGVNSLKGVNAWLGVINSNLESSSRTGFRKIRPSLTDGLGQTRSLARLELPSVTFNVQSTSYEWDEPGNIIGSYSSSHFALNGTGFFILADSLGRYYASRDGEFHWASDGYLVNSAGLKVVSTGQDFIRRGPDDLDDTFKANGSSYNLTRYGNKTMLIASFGALNNMTMSQYGSTVFTINGKLPFNLRNDLRNTADGLTYVYDDPIMTASGVAPTYTHTNNVFLANGMSGWIDVAAGANNTNTGRMLIGQAQQTVGFDLQTDFNLDAGLGAGARWMAINFGQNNATDEFSNTSADSGYQVRYSTTGVLEIYQAQGTGKAPVLLFTGALPVPVASASATLPTRLGMTVSSKGEISLTVFNPQTGTSGSINYSLGGSFAGILGYTSIQNTNSLMRLHNISTNFQHDYNPDVTGEMFRVNAFDPDGFPNVPSPPNPEVSPEIDAVSSLFAPQTAGQTYYDKRRGTTIVQHSLESSNASLMEFLPLLSLAQKVFSGVAKTISVYNQQADDLNGLVR